jgi:Tol biopolymer transport system component
MTSSTRILAGLTFAGGLILLAFAFAVSAAEAKSTIVWSSVDPNGARQRLVVAQPDGSNRHDLTDPKAKHTLDSDAQFSPDGTQVVFERDLRNGKDAQIVIIGADGQNEVVVELGCVDPCADDVAPTWSPGGDRINFTRVVGPFDQPNDSAHSAVLWSAFPGGSDIQRLSAPGIDGAYEDYFARYSPDGSYIVFTRVRNKPFNSAVFRMDVDGTDVRRLTPWRIDADLADLSPATSGRTKDLIAFETYGHDETRPEGKSSNVATVPSNCTSVSDCRKRIRFLTHHKGGTAMAFNSSWSPNGRRIAYTKFRDKTAKKPCCLGDIYTMRSDGSNRKPVSTSPRFEYRPDWGPAP